MVRKIEITFPVGVNIDDRHLQALDHIISRICLDYEHVNPTRIMWPFGHGSKMTVKPFMLDDNEPIPFDDSIYHVEVAEREKHPEEKRNLFKRTFLSYPPERMFHDIADFHEKFGLTYDGPPRRLPDHLGPFRIGFMAEELAEYVSGEDSDAKVLVSLIKKIYAQEGDDVSLDKQMDALIDLIYVALGTAYLQGFPMDEGWRRVHEANMRKVRAQREEQSARGSTFDVVKPEGWTAPDLSDLVQP